MPLLGEPLALEVKTYTCEMLLGLDAAVETEIQPVLGLQEILHNIHDICHLEEHEHLVGRCSVNSFLYAHDETTELILWPVENCFGRIRVSSSNLPADLHILLSSTLPVGQILSSTLSNKNGC